MHLIKVDVTHVKVLRGIAGLLRPKVSYLCTIVTKQLSGAVFQKFLFRQQFTVAGMQNHIVAGQQPSLLHTYCQNCTVIHQINTNIKFAQ